MKLLRTPVLLMALLLVLSANCFGYDLQFTDTHRYWGDGSDWGNTRIWNTDTANGSWNGNQIDVIGEPDIRGGTVVVNSGRIMSVNFTYLADDWRMLAPGNLFINVLKGSNDTTWDYIVTTMGNAKLNETDRYGNKSTLDAGYYNLYDISSKGIDARRGINDGSYIRTGADNSGVWTGYYLRNNHPIGIQGSALQGLTPTLAHYSGFPGRDDTWTGFSTYTFGDGIDLLGSRDFIVAWEMTCANDVVYEQVHVPAPEPGTLLLVAGGLGGLIFFKRRGKG